MYDARCKEATDDFDDFDGFWARQACSNVEWAKPFTRTLDESDAPFCKWFDDGELNASANCVATRAAPTRPPSRAFRPNPAPPLRCVR